MPRFSADNAGGKVKVNIKDSALTYPQWFEQTLRVDALDADLNWQVQDDGWHWQMTRLNAQNPDVKAARFWQAGCADPASRRTSTSI